MGFNPESAVDLASLSYEDAVAWAQDRYDTIRDRFLHIFEETPERLLSDFDDMNAIAIALMHDVYEQTDTLVDDIESAIQLAYLLGYERGKNDANLERLWGRGKA